MKAKAWYVLQWLRNDKWVDIAEFADKKRAERLRKMWSKANEGTARIKKIIRTDKDTDKDTDNKKRVQIKGN